MDAFEVVKLNMHKDDNPKSQKNIQIGLLLDGIPEPYVAMKRYAETHQIDLSLQRGYLRVPVDVIHTFFDGPINSTVAEVRRLLAMPQLYNLKYIFLVGGFAQSSILQNRIETEFESANRKVIVPSKPSIAVLSGAVQFGLQPRIIRSRIARYTYGFALYRSFKDGTDAEHMAVFASDGRKYCSRFEPMVTLGQDVELNHKVSVDVCPLEDTYTSVQFNVYRSNDEKPRYITEAYDWALWISRCRNKTEACQRQPNI
jgi:hypothetical protein